jgi:prepilin-type N-terminal cleavage/methylation domain-containing protein
MKNFLYPKPYTLNPQQGFTLTEVVVATAIFATVLTIMLTLFNYTLKINRRTEALRQASQSMRNFVEFLVREVRNGTIDYAATYWADCDIGDYGEGSVLALVNLDGQQECFYQDGADLMIVKPGLQPERLSPDNASLDLVKFIVRPTSQPKFATPPLQPMVTLVLQFTVNLPTGESVTIPYHTSISNDIYELY